MSGPVNSGGRLVRGSQLLKIYVRKEGLSL